MKKVKQSKKYWALTDAQKRRDRNKGRKAFGNSVPKWYCHLWSKKWRNIANRSLQKVKLGEDPDTLDFRTVHHKHIALWYWW